MLLLAVDSICLIDLYILFLVHFMHFSCVEHGLVSGWKTCHLRKIYHPFYPLLH